MKLPMAARDGQPPHEGQSCHYAGDEYPPNPNLLRLPEKQNSFGERIKGSDSPFLRQTDREKKLPIPWLPPTIDSRVEREREKDGTMGSAYDQREAKQKRQPLLQKGQRRNLRDLYESKTSLLKAKST
ncbi:hypothetical protein TIFTF001_037118 [Ficus carica]|uniref:Uncharacterized protein n=1 Tax=Ficus carica TaxID=3494 RepID=A0AA88E5P2_FICCA|nr:hypothetical protein TIFTF001_037108 [Ficus carica]GMN68057.1 hypothetical protein TIFTF001_037118 [Ficus carica]